MISAVTAIFCALANPTQCNEETLTTEAGNMTCAVSPSFVADYMREHQMYGRYYLKSWRCTPGGKPARDI